MHGSIRKLNQLPRLIIVGLLVSALTQIAYHRESHGSLVDRYKQLTEPASVGFYRAVSLGSDRLLSYLLLLNVQLHDNQKGRHRNYLNIDYDTLSRWLLRLYELNPKSDYPAFLASRVYSNVADKSRIRKMVEFIDTLFDKNPQQHWRRLTEACLLAKHQLEDLDLALRLAKKLADLPGDIKLPYWARDLKLVLLDNLGQLESAQLLILSMLKSGEIKDPDEKRFLKFRLLRIQQQLSKNKR
jgi:hypothetical protein